MNPSLLVIIGISLAFFIFLIISLFWPRRKRNGIFPSGAEEKLIRENRVCLKIAIPRNNDKTPLAAEQLFASLHGLYKESAEVPSLSLELAANSRIGVQFFIVVNSNIASFVKGQVYAQYPTAEITVVEDYMDVAVNWNESVQVSAGEIVLEREHIFPLKTFKDFDVDPLSGITGAISELHGDEEAWVQFVVRPYPNTWQKVAQKYIATLRSEGNNIFEIGGFWKGFWGMISGAIHYFVESFTYDPTKPAQQLKATTVRLEPFQEEEIKKVEAKAEKQGFQTVIRILAKSSDSVRAVQLFEGIAASFRQYATAHLNAFSLNLAKPPALVFQHFQERQLSINHEEILNIEELASLYHLPNTTGGATSLFVTTAGKLPPPPDLPIDEGTIIAKTNYRGSSEMFGIKKRDKRRHTYIIGRTGTGKTVMMRNMIVSDILAGEGVGLIDPHGETAEFILDHIPAHRVEDVIYFNPGDVEFPVGFNPIYVKDKGQRDLVADNIIGVFKKYFESWGPRLEYILYNTILSALDSQGTTLLSVQRMLTDVEYRKRVLSHVKDPMILRFWREEFAMIERNPKLLSDAVAPIQNKIGRYLSPRIIRNILGQTKSTFNIREMIDQKKIFIANLSKGRIGEENTSLIGGLLIARIYTAAMERVDVPEDDRNDFTLYIDEVQSFTTDAFVNILSEARKYRLSLVINHQFTEQLPIEMRAGIFGNVGTMIGFSVSQKDAMVLAQEFAPYVTPEDILALPNYQLYLRMTINDRISEPFSAVSMPFRYEPFGYRDIIKQKSREKYAVPRDVIEEKIQRWVENRGD
jgi:hypothetical protein